MLRVKFTLWQRFCEKSFSGNCECVDSKVYAERLFPQLNQLLMKLSFVPLLF